MHADDIPEPGPIAQALLREYHQDLARRRAASLSPDRRAAIARQGAKARWSQPRQSSLHARMKQAKRESAMYSFRQRGERLWVWLHCGPTASDPWPESNPMTYADARRALAAWRVRRAEALRKDSKP